MEAIERLEGVIGVGPVVSGGTEAERRVAFERFSQDRLERAYRLASVEKRGYEIDVTVEGDGRRSGGKRRLLAIGEAKASDHQRTTADLDRLERLRGELGSRADIAGTKLLLFGRSGFSDELRLEAEGRRDVELVDLARLYEGA